MQSKSKVHLEQHSMWIPGSERWSARKKQDFLNFTDFKDETTTAREQSSSVDKEETSLEPECKTFGENQLGCIPAGCIPKHSFLKKRKRNLTDWILFEEEEDIIPFMGCIVCVQSNTWEREHQTKSNGFGFVHYTLAPVLRRGKPFDVDTAKFTFACSKTIGNCPKTIGICPKTIVDYLEDPSTVYLYPSFAHKIWIRKIVESDLDNMPKELKVYAQRNISGTNAPGAGHEPRQLCMNDCVKDEGFLYDWKAERTSWIGQQSRRESTLLYTKSDSSIKDTYECKRSLMSAGARLAVAKGPSEICLNVQQPTSENGNIPKSKRQKLKHKRSNQDLLKSLSGDYSP